MLTPKQLGLRGRLNGIAYVVITNPAVSRVAPVAARLFPAPYRWLSQRYKTNRARLTDEISRLPARSLNDEIKLATPPDTLTADERACFARLSFAAYARRTRVSW